MPKDNFYKNSLLLTLTNLVTGVLRFVFAIFLSRTLGPEGMGLYSIIMPIYDLFCCLICGGIMIAISKEAAVFSGKHDYVNLHKTIHTSITFELMWAILISGMFFLTSSFISNYVIKDSRSLYSLWFIAPALVFVALSSILKGYFYGISNASLPAAIDICEKTIRIIVVIAIIYSLSLTDITQAVTATYASLMLGELISFLLLYVFYKRDSSRKSNSVKKFREENSAQLLFNVLAVSFPLCINGFLTTSLSTVSTLVIPRKLVEAGLNHIEALGIVGKFSGMALTIVYFPMIVIMSVSLILIPDLSKNVSTGDYYSVEKRIKEVLKLAFTLGTATLVLCATIPNSFGMLFFQRNDLGSYIAAAGFTAPLTYLSMTTYGILNGFGKQKIVLRNSVITAVIQLGLCFILIGIPSINIYGYVIALLVSSTLGFIMNYIEIHKTCYLEFNIGEIIIILCIAAFTYYTMKILSVLIPTSLGSLKGIALIISGFSMFFMSYAFISSFTRRSSN